MAIVELLLFYLLFALFFIINLAFEGKSGVGTNIPAPGAVPPRVNLSTHAGIGTNEYVDGLGRPHGPISQLKPQEGNNDGNV